MNSYASRFIKPLLFICALLLFQASLAFSQTAAEMDALLKAEKVSAAVAARFVLEAAGHLQPGLTGQKAEASAYDMAKTKGWLAGGAADELNLKETAFLVMSAFDIKGGIMYSFFPGPRYAYREMVYRKLIQGRADPDMNVSGQRLLQIIGRVMSSAGAEAKGDI